MVKIHLDRLRFRSKRTIHQLQNNLHERKYKKAFADFYQGLADKKDIFYMVFPPGLIHWVQATSACVPEDVNLVLIGMGMTRQEETWIREHIPRPLHHIGIKVDDQWVWEQLFANNRNNFGWLDVDLFVFNPELFDQMAKIEDDVSVNCAWSYPSPSGLDILSTHFLFINMAAIKALRHKGFHTSPCVHNYQGLPLGRFYPKAYSKIPRRREIKLLRTLLPSGPDGLPAYPSATYDKFWFNGFDTMVLFQLVSKGHGFRLEKIRQLNGVSATKGHYSDELIHIAAISYYELFLTHQDQRLQNYYRLILQFDYLMLEHTSRKQELPKTYLDRAQRLRKNLDELGLDPRKCAQQITHYFAAQGVGRHVFQNPLWHDLWHDPRVINQT